MPPNPPEFLKDNRAIYDWLTLYCVVEGTVDIDAAYRVAVNGNIYLKQQYPHPHLHVQLSTVSGHMGVGDHDLLSLAGCPSRVGGNFSCQANKRLTSLEGGPEHVGGWYSCSGTAIPDLTGSPRIVSGDFFMGECRQLTSFKGAPTLIGGTVLCGNNTLLSSFDGLPPGVRRIAFLNMPTLSLKEPVIAQVIDFDRLAKPEPACVKAWLVHKSFLDTKQKAKWISIVNDYHKSGDLLMAISQFEAYYKVSFGEVKPAEPSTVGVPEL